MLEILKYIFSSGWIFIGTVIIIYVVGEVISTIVTNICRTIIACKSVKYSKDTNIRIE
ncbi:MULTISPECIES: hypothetical protein [unclassified Clostridium]|uniref:hypothetical protein n=1 Tax=unclassified Clostridium TaxID=2614128 RepID=UPI000297CDED|nr:MULTISPECIES: hypothetical protein [unclassified Clostridium]EKQ50284.1 MAG: hypothetical protein A370_05730 [Clostridium sp. Maddingley MBC34-26]